MWIKISDRKPKKLQRVITRSPGHNGKGDSIESWREYKIIKLIPPISHWWDGPYDMDLAAKIWFDKVD